MKKVVLPLLILGFALSFANAKGVFIGIDAEYQKISGLHENIHNYKGPLAEKMDHKFKALMPIFGFKGGYDFDKFRTYGKFSYGLSKDINFQFLQSDSTSETVYKFKIMEFIAGADWTPNVIKEIEAGYNLKVAIGAFVGASSQKVSYETDKCCNVADGKCSINDKHTQEEFENLINKTETSFLLGAKVGGIFEINRHTEIELGLTYSKNFAKMLKTDKFSGFIGYNYKF